MRGKIIITVMAALALLSGCLSGCGNSGSDRDKAVVNEAKGRYVEKDFTYPNGVSAEECMALLKNPEGNLELFYADAQSGYGRGVRVDGQWNKEDMKGILEALASNNIPGIRDFFYGEDGLLYLLCFNMDYNTVLYRVTEDGSCEMIAIDKMNEKDEELGITYRPDEIEVLSNGAIAVKYLLHGIEVYSPDGRTKLNEFETGKTCKMAAEGNTLYYMNQDCSELLSLDLETNEEGTARKIDAKITDSSQLTVEKGTVYLCDADGIHRNPEGSSIWETTVDGHLCSLSTPSRSMKAIIAGAENDYYVMMAAVYSNASASLLHYVYDKDISSVPSKELTLYALKDSRTIRQAIVTFQKANPDVYVNFRVADTAAGMEGDKGGSATNEDYIKTLNTELLAGKGADILILDGLPVDSYIEKGVLEDMSDIFEPMAEAGELQDNITGNYIADGKVYDMPLRFTIPVIYGIPEAVNALGSLKEFKDYANANGKPPLLAPSSYRAMTAWFLLLNYDSLLDQDGRIKEAALTEFLKNVNDIAININASDDVEIDYFNDSYGKTTGYWVGSGINVAVKEVQSNIQDIRSLNEFAIVLGIIKNINGDYAAINNMFSPYLLLGINSGGRQKELAKEFTKYLFSREMQEVDLGEGFSVNSTVLKNIRETDIEGNYGGTMSSPDFDYVVEYTYPDKEERITLFEKINTLSSPMLNDTSLTDLILDEAESYLRGDITAEQASRNAVNNTETYLAE